MNIGTTTPDIIKNVENISANIYKYKCENDEIIVFYYQIENLNIDNFIVDNNRTELFDCELNLLTHAMDYLNIIEDSETWYNGNKHSYPHNSVAINFLYFNEKENKNDIHTTTIWKKSTNIYYILDPNKSIFSKKIEDLLNLHFLNYGTFEIPEIWDKCYNCSEEDKRDCTNIAIRNSFFINEFHKKISIESILSEVLNKSSSNSNTIFNLDRKKGYKIMFDNKPNIIQHSTNKNQVEEFDNLVLSLGKHGEKFPNGKLGPPIQNNIIHIKEFIEGLDKVDSSLKILYGDKFEFIIKQRPK